MSVNVRSVARIVAYSPRSATLRRGEHKSINFIVFPLPDALRVFITVGAIADEVGRDVSSLEDEACIIEGCT